MSTDEKDKDVKKPDKKGIIKEFKEFISKGNVLDMAVGLIVGTAFTAIVKSLVEDIFMPIIGMLIGGINFAGLNVTIGDADSRFGAATLTYGNFIQSVLTFLLTAICVFSVIKVINLFRKKNEKKPEPPKPSDEVKLLAEIRDLLKNGNVAEAAKKADESEKK